MWSPDGRKLFYRPSTGGGLPIALKAVDINATLKFTFSNERTLPIENFSTVSYYRGFDITPDGTEFIMTFPDATKSSESKNRKIIIVANWIEELKERVPLD